MPPGAETDIAVMNERIIQVCKNIALINANVEKMANGQEKRMRALEKYQAQAEERWENHWMAHSSTAQATAQTWADHKEEHKKLDGKVNLYDRINALIAVGSGVVAGIFGANK